VLCKKGAPKAIPTMCNLTIKKDENLLPLRAKSCIVVLGTHEDWVWFDSECFAPVLCQDSLCFLGSLAIASRRPLCQGDCENALCQGILPDNEITILCPPMSNPKAAPDKYRLLQKTLYGLRWSPRHWYDEITPILFSLGLCPSLEDPCLFTGFVWDPLNPSASPSSLSLSLGIYVDTFFIFLKIPRLKSFSVNSYHNVAKLTSWGLSSGSLPYIF
jgi:hypothetical protein